jgi:hypothetical protein
VRTGSSTGYSDLNTLFRGLIAATFAVALSDRNVRVIQDLVRNDGHSGRWHFTFGKFLSGEFEVRGSDEGVAAEFFELEGWILRTMSVLGC